MSPIERSRRIRRRDFVRRMALTAGAVAAGCARFGEDRLPEKSDLRITRVQSFAVRSERWKVVGKNSHLDVHGKFARDRVIRIDTSAGIEGVGSCSARREEAAALVGQDPLSYFDPRAGVRSPLGSGDAALWDLVGKIHGRPVWRLLGADGPEWIPVYDGSIYFNDIEDGFPQKGVDRLLYEVDYALERGHRAFKIKIGRGYKWMEREAGLRRDVEVVRAIRRAVGPDIKLMVDANNGYDLETTKRFLSEADDDFYFVEEMFPETVDGDTELKAWLRARGRKTLVADGESAKDVGHFAAYIEAGALDVLQGDIRRFGFTRLLELSRLARPSGMVLAPHNWGSVLGLYMQVTLGRGVPNFLMAEQDPARTDVFAAPGFDFRDGMMRVPETPGCGLVLRRGALGRGARIDWEVA